ncbi:MAG: hypothetical protein WA584_12105 [Pyrinomonadaceae bacterium]
MDLAHKIERESLVADILCHRAYIYISWYNTQRLITKYLYVPFNYKNLGVLKQNVELSLNIFVREKLIESQLRAKNILADILSFEKNHLEANKINLDVSNLAHDLNYANVKYLAENPIVKRTTEILERKVDNPHESILNFNDEKIGLYARQRIDALKIPKSRTSNIEKSLFAQRDIANERLSWCQYIDIDEDKSHTISPITYFSIDPARVILCNIHPYMSENENPNWKPLIIEFKKKYCENCPDRKPKADKT